MQAVEPDCLGENLHLVASLPVCDLVLHPQN